MLTDVYSSQPLCVVYRHMAEVFAYRRRFCVARLLIQGNARASECGTSNKSESYAFFCAVIVVRIGNICNPIVLPTASVDNYFFCYSMKMEPRRGGILQAGV